MGKASSSKKVARAAKAGGSKARAAGERNFLFPAMLVIVVVLGLALIVYARDERLSEAQSTPQIGDHIHMAYGFYACGEWGPTVPEFTAPLNGGNHTHGDGLFHIHPFSSSRTGENANIGNWMRDAGEALGVDGALSDTTLQIPTGEEYIEGETECPAPAEGEEALTDPILQVAVWDRAQAAVAGEEPDEILTEGLGGIHLDTDGKAYTIAFMPEGADIPFPPSASQLASVTDDLGVDPAEVPAELGGEGPSVSSPDATDPATETSEPGTETSDPATETSEPATETSEPTTETSETP